MLTRYNRFLLLLCFTFVNVVAINSQITADFTSNITSGCPPSIISFEDISISPGGAIVSREWDLGGVSVPGTDNNPTPARIFSTAGKYTVCLTVTNDAGESDTKCVTDYIDIFEKPNVDFTADATTGCFPFEINFESTSAAGSAPITNYSWSLGDGSVPPNAETFAYSYTQTGTFDVTLVAIDANGCNTFLNKVDYITINETPVADFNVSNAVACTVPHEVSLTNLSSSTTGTLSYNWDFGDTGTSTQESPDYIYATVGAYDVQLIATDIATGCADTVVQQSAINLQSNVSFTNAGLACEESSMSFIPDVANMPGSSYLWSFGDGNTSTSYSPNHTYDNDGCYVVTFESTINGCNSIDTLDCLTIHAKPNATIDDFGPLTGCSVPHEVNAFAVGDANIIDWQWQFNNSNNVSGQQASFSYNQEGTFQTSLSVENNFGCSNEFDGPIVEIESPQITVTNDFYDGCKPLSTTFTGDITSLYPIESWEWIFGDGDTSFLESPTHVYVDTGFYSIQVTIVDTGGCSQVLNIPNYIAVGETVPVDFEPNPASVCADEPITFINNTPPDIVDQWLWDFGDGGTSTDLQPTYVFADTGYFSIALTANVNGCESAFLKDSLVHVDGPIGAFVHAINCTDRFTVDFINQSIGGHVWAWDFGVDTLVTDVSNLENPTYTFPGAGTYQINYIVTDTITGCDYEVQSPITITSPIADFSIDTTSGCIPLTVNITNNSVDYNTADWTVNGGVKSPANDIITYTNSGEFSGIQLVITDEFGCRDTAIIVDTIRASDIDVDFSVDINGGCDSMIVEFTNSSTTVLGNITGYNWNFGDGNSSIEESPIHNYTTVGEYAVRLTVSNDMGCVRQRTKNNFVSITSPVANFTVDSLGCLEQNFTFNGNSSQGLGLTNFEWSYGDGVTELTAITSTHQYSANGFYDVCMNLQDKNGCVDTICKPSAVHVEDPFANFTGLSPDADAIVYLDSIVKDCFPLEVNFVNASIGTDRWFWSFGDGNSSNGSIEDPTHVYTQPGIYDVRLISSSGGVCRDTLIKEEFIKIDGPTGALSYTPSTGCVNDSIEIVFYAEALGQTQYIYDFGDGNVIAKNSTLPFDTISYFYKNPGTYVPQLGLIDENNCSNVYVGDSPILIESVSPDFTNIDVSPCDDYTMAYTSTTTAVGTIQDITWSFPGATTPTSSSSANPIVKYPSPGSYTAQLIATTEYCQDTFEQLITINPAVFPQAQIDIQPDTADCLPFYVEFNDATNIASGVVTQWEWDLDEIQATGVADTSHTYTFADTFDISLIVTSDRLCKDTAYRTVIGRPIAIADAGVNDTLCLGESVQLNGVGGVSPSWSPSSTVSCINCYDPIVTPTTTTDYIIQVENEFGCIDKDTVNVLVYPFPIPTVVISNDTSLCAKDTLQLFVGGGETGIATYEWDDSIDGLSCYDCPDPFVDTKDTIKYFVTVYNNFFCYNSDSVEIEVVDVNTPLNIPSTTICQGDSIQLTTSIGHNHVWSPNVSISNTTSANPYVYPNSDQYYIANVAIGPDNCPVADTTEVFVVPANSINAGSNQLICEGTVLQLSAIGFGTSVWDTDPTLSDVNVLDPIVSPSTLTKYYLTSSEGDCILRDSVSINVTPAPNLSIPDFEICRGDTILVNAKSIATNYSWSPSGSLSHPNGPVSIAYPLTTTNYEVSASVANCPPVVATFEVLVNQPTEIIHNNPKGFYEGQEVTIEVTDIDPLTTYSFYKVKNGFDSLICHDCLSIEVLPDTTTQYLIEALDENGCESQEVKLLKELFVCQDDPGFIIPNAFTPNDDGLNDVFYLRGGANLKTFRIFNRIGELVFETTSQDIGWDGIYEGQKVNPGVFVYYVEAACPSGESVLLKGNVTVIR